MKNSIFARFARAFVIFWHFEDVLVTWNELFCRCVITLGICVLELNCNQRFRDKKTKLNICHHMLTSTTQLSRRGKNENVCQMFKNKKCTCKASKTIVFLCQICTFVRFLLPSSSWLLKLPIHFGEQIGMRGFSFWVVSLKWGSNWLEIATHTERRLKIQVSSTAVVKLLFWTYITVRERISTLSSDLQFTSVLTSIILTSIYVYLFPFRLLSEQESLGKNSLFTSLVPIPVFLKDCARTCSADICHLISSKAINVARIRAVFDTKAKFEDEVSSTSLKKYPCWLQIFSSRYDWVIWLPTSRQLLLAKCTT